MRQFKRGLWKAGIALCGIQLLLALVMWLQVSAAHAHAGTSGLATPVTITAQATATEDTTVSALNKEKLLQDVDQQQHTLGNWFWTNGAAIISSLVLVIAGVFTVFRYLRDQRNEREKQRNEHQIEREKRAEERFQSAVAALGDEKEGTRIGAAILLRTFLHPDYEQFHTQIFDLVVANLRLPRTAHQPVDPTLPQPMTPFSQALVTLIKESFPLVREKLQKEHPQFSPESLDASRILLDHAYLSGADLKQAWLPVASLRGASLSRTHLEGADLSEADLSQAYLSRVYLNRVRLFGAHFREAELQNAHLDEAYLRRADLRGVDLSGADLSRANLEEADLSETLLSGANLSQANLRGADLSAATLKATRTFMTTHMAEMNLDAANLSGADLTRANLTGANLSGVNLEAALSLKDADVRQVIGLTKEQLVACRAKGAILDEDATTLSS
jgi:uncharacterized protein YjbI with pentapeptide repeats